MAIYLNHNATQCNEKIPSYYHSILCSIMEFLNVQVYSKSLIKITFELFLPYKTIIVISLQFAISGA